MQPVSPRLHTIACTEECYPSVDHIAHSADHTVHSGDDIAHSADAQSDSSLHVVDAFGYSTSLMCTIAVDARIKSALKGPGVARAAITPHYRPSTRQSVETGATGLQSSPYGTMHWLNDCHTCNTDSWPASKIATISEARRRLRAGDSYADVRRDLGRDAVIAFFQHRLAVLHET